MIAKFRIPFPPGFTDDIKPDLGQKNGPNSFVKRIQLEERRKQQSDPKI